MNIAVAITTSPQLHAGDVVEPFERCSRQSIERIQMALQSFGHTTFEVEADLNLASRLLMAGRELDVVYNCARGLRGLYKASYAPVVFDMLRIPYTSSDALTLATCADKITLKEHARRMRIQTPPAWLCSSLSDVRRQLPKVTAPLIVKPNNFDLAVGITEGSICRTLSDLTGRVDDLISDGLGPVIVERYVQGHELSCVVIGSGHDAQTLPLVETALADGLELFGLEARAALLHGAEVAEFRRLQGVHRATCESINAWSIALCSNLGVRDFAVVEFIVGVDGVPYLIEVNPLPDVSDFGVAGSVLSKAVELEGLSLDELIESAVSGAVSRFGVTERVEQQLGLDLVDADEEEAVG